MRQHARSFGISLKDHNTKFFHASTLYRRKRNEIVRIMIDGRVVEGVSGLNTAVRQYFACRFTQEPVPDFDLNMDGHSTISTEQNIFLEAFHTREEVKEAVWACGIDKAPGFDGYNFKSIREMWDILENDIFDFVVEFFRSGYSARNINVTWVCLIPKIVAPICIDDYRPISMVGALYKIISKLLSSRLKVVIAPLIDESQSVFVRDRQILDGV